MVNCFINSHKSLLDLLGLLRASVNDNNNNNNNDSTPFQLRSLTIDSDASKLSSNINAWGPLLSALTLPACAHFIRTLEVCNVNQEVAALVVPHIAKLAQNFTQLESFALRRAPIGSKTAQFLGACLNRHPSLKKVIVEQCDLRSEGATIFVSHLLEVKATVKNVQTELSMPLVDEEKKNVERTVDDKKTSPLEIVDLGYNEIRASACSEIASLVRNVVTQRNTDNTNNNNNNNCSYPKLHRVEFRGNNFVFSNSQEKGEGMEKDEMLRNMFVSGGSNNNKKNNSKNRSSCLPALLPGQNLKFMTSADKDCGFKFPNLDVLANQVKEDFSFTKI